MCRCCEHVLCYRIQETDKKLGVVPVEFSIQRVVRLYFERLADVVGRAQLDAYLSRAGSACWSRPQPKLAEPLRSQFAAKAQAARGRGRGRGRGTAVSAARGSGVAVARGWGSRSAPVCTWPWRCFPIRRTRRPRRCCSTLTRPVGSSLLRLCIRLGHLSGACSRVGPPGSAGSCGLGPGLWPSQLGPI